MEGHDAAVAQGVAALLDAHLIGLEDLPAHLLPGPTDLGLEHIIATALPADAAAKEDHDLDYLISDWNPDPKAVELTGSATVCAQTRAWIESSPLEVDATIAAVMRGADAALAAFPPTPVTIHKPYDSNRRDDEIKSGRFEPLLYDSAERTMVRLLAAGNDRAERLGEIASAVCPLPPSQSDPTFCPIRFSMRELKLARRRMTTVVPRAVDDEVMTCLASLESTLATQFQRTNVMTVRAV